MCKDYYLSDILVLTQHQNMLWFNLALNIEFVWLIAWHYINYDINSEKENPWLECFVIGILQHHKQVKHLEESPHQTILYLCYFEYFK